MDGPLTNYTLQINISLIFGQSKLFSNIECYLSVQNKIAFVSCIKTKLYFKNFPNKNRFQMLRISSCKKSIFADRSRLIILSVTLLKNFKWGKKFSAK